MFPSLPSVDPPTFGQIAHCLNILSRSVNANCRDKLADDWAGAGLTTTVDGDTFLPEPLAKSDRPEVVVERELGDAIAEAGEALCMAEGKRLW